MDNNFHTVRGYQIIGQNKGELTSAMEDYLEMIYRNVLQGGYMRINTLSQLLNVKPSSTTKMVQKLSELKLVDYKKYGIILLTDSGKQIGEFLLKRHIVIEKFLNIIGITDNTLDETELIEHNISIKTMENIDLLNMFLEINPDIAKKFDKFKSTYSEQGYIK